MTLGPVTCNCWALLEVVQRFISTPSEVMISVGLEAKHHHSFQPSSPTCREGDGHQLQGQPRSSARDSSDWPVGLN